MFRMKRQLKQRKQLRSIIKKLWVKNSENKCIHLNDLQNYTL
jgi:hypothetical protein